MGLILLIGLVKNGIMLPRFSERLHGDESSNRDRSCGRIRLRPILMTTLHALRTAATGARTGVGAGCKAPGAAVIGGLALSTPVTLLVVPGLYAAVKRR